MVREESQLIKAALYYAQRGWRVLPLAPKQKIPLIKKWQIRATNKKWLVREWWGKTPDANVGIATGKETGLVVLDVDTQHYGDWTLASLILDHGNLPETIISQTGQGGVHYLFKYPSVEIRNTACLGRGLDVRGEGGYIVAPPSIHPNGECYSWKSNIQEHPVAELPAWLLQMMITRPSNDIPDEFPDNPPIDKGINFLYKALEKIDSGMGRNQAGMWLACQLRDIGFCPDTALNLMTMYMGMCPKNDHPYTIEEATRTLHNAYQSKRRGTPKKST